MFDFNSHNQQTVRYVHCLSNIPTFLYPPLTCISDHVINNCSSKCKKLLFIFHVEKLNFQFNFSDKLRVLTLQHHIKEEIIVYIFCISGHVTLIWLNLWLIFLALWFFSSHTVFQIPNGGIWILTYTFRIFYGFWELYISNGLLMKYILLHNTPPFSGWLHCN